MSNDSTPGLNSTNNRIQTGTPVADVGSPRGWLLVLFGLVFVVVIVVVGLNWASDAPTRAVQDIVRQTLRDPDSAQFRNMRQIPNGFCGEVNGKNAFGGMSGFSPFYVRSVGADGNVPPHVFRDPRMIEVMCEVK